MIKGSLLQVGMEFCILRPAGTVIVPGKPACRQRFRESCFRERVGDEFPLRSRGKTVGTVTLVSAHVAEDGSCVNLCYRIVQLLEKAA